jgi:hypothetical protein
VIQSTIHAVFAASGAVETACSEPQEMLSTSGRVALELRDKHDNTTHTTNGPGIRHYGQMLQRVRRTFGKRYRIVLVRLMLDGTVLDGPKTRAQDSE